MKVSFIVPGEPKGKGRPRFVKMGEHTKAITPKDTVVYENLVKMAYMNSVGEQMLDGEISATIIGVFPIPKSVSKKKREKMIEGKILHTKKVDCDNLAKVILDSLNKVAYDDDKQVCKLLVEKKYGENPHVEVILEEIEH